MLLVFLLACLCSPLPLAAAPSETWCRDRGFDPSNLSCDTCALLKESATLRSLQETKNAAAGEGPPVDVVAECRSCCQAWKSNTLLRPGTSLAGKYQSALLTYGGEHTLDQEMRDFMERDMDDLVLLKGKAGFQAVKSEELGGGPDQDMLMMLGMMGGGGMGPPKLMLFKTRKKGGWREEDEKEAGEVIVLRGWKREDLKDMLLTLLPNA